MKKLIILLVGIIIFSQNIYASERDHHQKTDVKNAISEMLTKKTDPFVIVEVTETKKFIQFYNDNGRILIDFPNIELTSAELLLAKKYFNKNGIEMQQSVDKDPKTMKTHVTETWTKTFAPQQIDLVVNIALGALFEIYDIKSSTPLTIITGWE